MVIRNHFGTNCIFYSGARVELSLAEDPVSGDAVGLQIRVRNNGDAIWVTLSPPQIERLADFLSPFQSPPVVEVEPEPDAPLPHPSAVPYMLRPRLSLSDVCIGDHVILAETGVTYVVDRKIEDYWGSTERDIVHVHELTNSDAREIRYVNLFVAAYPSDCRAEPLPECESTAA